MHFKAGTQESNFRVGKSWYFINLQQFNAFPLNIPYVSGWKSVSVTRSVSIWQDLCLAREKQMVQIWSPHPKVPLFLQKEQLEMNIWNFVVGIIIRIRNIFLNTILWSSRSFTAFHSVCQTHETPRSPDPEKNILQAYAQGTELEGQTRELKVGPAMNIFHDLKATARVSFHQTCMYW